MANHKDNLGTDAEGRYRRSLGTKEASGKRSQHLFRLGRSKIEASRRNALLERLWERVERNWQARKAAGKATEPCPLWWWESICWPGRPAVTGSEDSDRRAETYRC